MNGGIATLSHFVTQVTDKCHPFFQALKVGKNFKWNEKCKIALQALKAYLGKLPLLSKNKTIQEHYLYLVVLEHAVSAILVREEEKVQ